MVIRLSKLELARQKHDEYYEKREKAITKVVEEYIKSGRKTTLHLFLDPKIKEVQALCLVKVFKGRVRFSRAMAFRFREFTKAISSFESQIRSCTQPNEGDYIGTSAKTLAILKNKLGIFWALEKKHFRFPVGFFISKPFKDESCGIMIDMMSKVRGLALRVWRCYKEVLSLDGSFKFKFEIMQIRTHHLSRISEAELQKRVYQVFKAYNDVICHTQGYALRTIPEETI